MTLYTAKKSTDNARRFQLRKEGLYCAYFCYFFFLSLHLCVASLSSFSTSFQSPVPSIIFFFCLNTISCRKLICIHSKRMLTVNFTRIMNKILLPFVQVGSGYPQKITVLYTIQIQSNKILEYRIYSACIHAEKH